MKRFAIEMTQEQALALHNVLKDRIDELKSIKNMGWSKEHDEVAFLERILFKLDLAAKEQLKKDAVPNSRLSQ